MKAKLALLRNQRSAKNRELESLRSRRAAMQTREDELADAIDAAAEVSPDLEAQVNALAEEQTNVDAAISAAENAIAALDSAIAAEQNAAADAIETAIETDPADVDDPGVYVAGIRPGSQARGSGSGAQTRAARQQRAADFQRTGRQKIDNVPAFLRSPVLVTGSTIAKPTGVSGINDGVGLSTVSSIVDMVNVEDCTGMGTYRVAYQDTELNEAAAYTLGSAPTEVEPGFNYVDLTPSSFATISYVDKGIRKQSPLNYEDKVRASARVALRKRLSKMLAECIPASALAEKLEIVSTAASYTIGADFLSNLILSYGGDEDVDGNGVLFLAKEDLKAFAAVRGKNEYLPVYSIIPDAGNPNSGVIKDNYGLSCRYCLNRYVSALTGATLTTSATTHMFYGNPKAVTLGLWGTADVEVSDGYKFAEGLLTVRGEVSAAADLTAKNGFIVVSAKKSA